MRTGIMRPETGVSPCYRLHCNLVKVMMPPVRHLSCVSRVSKRPDNSRPSDGIDEAAYRELSPEARQVFKEAQENILALNGSRMRALQELRAANEKIAELEKKLEDATTQISKLATRHSSAASSILEPELHPRTSSQAAASPPPTALITLSYVTGWDVAYLHFQIDDQPWTSLPGLQMENDGAGSNSTNSRKKISVPGRHMKFVVTNGLGKFDTPNPYGDPNQPKNYEINEPGEYLLEAGNLTKL